MDNTKIARINSLKCRPLAMLFLCFVTFTLCISPLQATEDKSREYTVGVVPQFNVREIARIWSPILEAISKQTGLKLKLSLSPSIPEFENQFSEGKFDFAYMNPYHALVANHTQGYKPIIRDTSKRLRGIIVVRKNSSLSEISQLDGKKIAMPAPNALGAALLPRAEFATIYKIKPEINYVKSHDSVYLNVVLGIADAGGGVMRSFKKQPTNVRNNLRVLYRTQGVSTHPVVAHPAVPDNIREQFQKSFLNLSHTKEGKKMLAQIPMSSAGATSLKDYDSLKKLGLDAFYVDK